MHMNIEIKDEFQKRHLGPRDHDRNAMLKTIGMDSMEELISKTVPENIRLKQDLNLPQGISEFAYLAQLKKRISKNKIFKSYLGMGFYDTITPSVILRNIFENPGWYTQYTPYQAEIAQGRLEALLNFQTVVMDLTKMEVANASLLDDATAAAEAMTMSYRLRKGAKVKAGANQFLVSDKLHAHIIDVLKTRSEPLGIELMISAPEKFSFNDKTFGAVVQLPNDDGFVQNFEAISAHAHENNSLLTVVADLLSLALIKAPGEMGADIVVGTTQRFGVPMGFGGPHAGYFATRDAYKRQLPGRIIGLSIDRHGNPAYRMSLQTREQHIRGEKATSNICTAQALLAIIAGMYAVYHGPEGIKEIAARTHGYTKILDEQLKKMGFEQQNATYFDTLKITHPKLDMKKARTLFEENEINLRYFSDAIGIACDETTRFPDINQLLSLFSNLVGEEFSPLTGADFLTTELDFPENLTRTSAYLEHPVFNNYHSETEMMRYIKMLENRDLSLNTAMIPLGSCTMKLNAATSMIPVTWPEISKIHPFVPNNQVEGYHALIDEMADMLCEITGFKGISFQPNSGAQGEYTGLLVIRAYFKSIGEEHRNIVLIPSSAHGTNPASASLAGMKIVIVKCDDKGNVDIADLKAKAELNSENLAAYMITYPSTHGVFEESIVEMLDIIHENGGQVYMDGANMNAQVGLTSPGTIGADVCHLNLHKTFSIPHGGGGPGVGPIGVAAHLVPFLPGHSVVETGGEKGISAVSATGWGSASVLPISYAYMKMLGRDGLRAATENAILNANYIKARLKEHYKALFTGKNGTVAHEMIVDVRMFKESANIEVEDFAKRLIDYGFHAPTVAWPVHGTMMIEPTESESKEELDRFCNALIGIYNEIEAIKMGTADKEDNVLKNAPHTANEVTANSWEHSYSREEAAYPLSYIKNNKFWPFVARVNNTHGDRNLICSCPPIESYEE